MKKAFYLLTLFVIITGAAYAQATERGYGKVRWGDSINAVKREYQGLEEEDLSDLYRSSYWAVILFMEHLVRGTRIFQQREGDKDIGARTFVFINDKLYQVLVGYTLPGGMTPARQTAILSALMRRYDGFIKLLYAEISHDWWHERVSQYICFFGGTSVVLWLHTLIDDEAAALYGVPVGPPKYSVHVLYTDLAAERRLLADKLPTRGGGDVPF
jgi:hypothetical protein